MTALLELDEVSKRFGGLQAVHNLSFDHARGRNPRPYRAERRRQVDPVQSDQRRVTRRMPGGSCLTARILPGEKPYRVARYGLARTHQIVQPLTNMTVLENCTVGACFGRENLPLAQRARGGA